ncbi:TipJ family phage tail tip protein [Halomonas sp. GT]|uniref:TipJ family phage tail tip protein n=1 Tax=Halomonas sp. GT TaxID=1971364 RepID=UPI0009F2A6FA|nr:phage tail protein [Halomonas sp. GT]
MKQLIEGAGGGGKGSGGGSQRTPQEAPNTLRATSKARIIDLLGEGPIGGLVNGMQSIYFDGTPLQAANGDWNFEGVTVHTRNGEPDQAHIPGFPAVESTTEVSAQVKQGSPVIRTINTPGVDAVRVTIQLPALSYQNVDNGDLLGTTVELAIDVRLENGSWQEKRRDTIEGKTTSPYQRSYRIELDGAGPWDVRLRRISHDDDTATKQNDTYWAYFTTITDAKLSYPDSALVGVEVDAQQFGNQIPPRAYEVYGLVVQVPDNYDPETRAYSGFWGGNFKLAWSDNPAWCYYDVAMKVRYGAGLRNVDKWELYRIAQYCDELVPDGFGGEEPRFTFNTVMADEVDAMRALHTLASAFRGMTYWGTNTVMPVADMPSDPVKLVTPANVIDGEFVYEGTALKARHSVAHVSYNDPDDQYQLSVEVVEDSEALEQFGYRKIDVDAVACTSRAQAHRLGKWILASERAETETVSYRCSVDHADVRPGDIIKISDPSTAGARLGGRLTATGLDSLTLDQVPEQANGNSWFIDVMLPNGRPERRPVGSFNGPQVQLSQPLSAVPVNGAMWILSSQSVEPRQFRVLANSESSDEKGRLEYHITALEHDPTKYARIELGIDLELPSYSLLPTGPVVAPYSITAQAFTYLAGGTEHQGMTISWTPSDDPRVLRYIVEVQGPSDLRWRTVYTESGTSIDLRDVEPGQWMIRVRGVTGIGTASPWAALTTNITGLLLPVPPDSVDIEVGTFSVTLRPKGQYPGQVWEFWRSQVALETAMIESNAINIGVATVLTDTGLKSATTYYYYVRGVNVYGVSSWFPVQATTAEDFDDILGAVDKDLRKPGGIVDQFENDVNNVNDAISSVSEDVDAAQQSATQAIADAQAALDAAVSAGNGVDAAQATADNALNDAREALDLAQANAVAVTAAQATADQADTDAKGAQLAASDALAEAQAALAEAQANGVGVDAAQAAADQAAVDAQTAMDVASGAGSSALAAQQTASDAITRAQKALDDLDLVALEQQIQTASLQAQVALSNAVMDVESVVRVGEEQALAQRIATLRAELETASASLTERLTTLATTTEAIAASLTQLRTEYDDTTAAFDQQITLLSDTAQSLSSSITGLRTEYEGAIADIRQQLTTLSDDTQALATANQALRSEFEDNAASIGNTLTTLVNDQQSLASDVSQYQAATDGRLATAEDSLTVLADDTQALTQQANALRSDVDENTATASENTQTIALNELAQAVYNASLQAQNALGNAIVDVENVVRTDEEQSLAQRIIELSAVFGDNKATVDQQLTALTNANQALSSALNTLRSEYDDSSVEVSQSITALVNQTQSIGQTLDSLSAAYNDSTADFEQRITTLADDTQALAATSSQLQSALDGVNARVATEETTRASEDAALASANQALRSEFEDNAASVGNTLTTLANDQQSLASDVSQYQAATDGRLATAEDSLTVLADDTQALTQQANALRSDVDDNTATASENTQTIALNELAQAVYNASLQAQNALGNAIVDVENVVRTDEEQSLAQRIIELSAVFGDNKATVDQQLTALTNANQALSSALNTLRSEYDDSSVEVSQSITALVNQTQSIGQTLDSLSAAYNDSTADFEQRITTLADDTQALTQQANALRSDVDDNTATASENTQTIALNELAQAVYNASLQAQNALGNAIVDVENVVRMDEEQSLAQRIIELSAVFGDNKATVDQQLTALTNANQALSSALNTLRSEYDDSSVEVSQSITALVNQTQSIGQTLDSLSAAYNDSTADFEQRITTLADDTQALAATSSQMQSALDGVNARVATEETTRASEDAALASTNQALRSEFEDNAASVGNTLTTLANDQQSLASDVSQYQAATDERLATAESTIVALSDDQQALAGRIDAFEVAVDDELASVQQELSAVYDPVSGAVAQAVTTVNVNGVKGVIGVQVAGEEAQIIGIANQFAILNPVNNQLVTAFVVSDGRVIMPEAFIDALTITKLRSSTGSLVFENDKLQAAFIAVEQLEVQWAQIKNVLIKNAQIENAAVTTLKLAGNAVTVPVGGQSNGPTPLTGSWTTVMNVQYDSPGTLAEVTASATIEFAGTSETDRCVIEMKVYTPGTDDFGSFNDPLWESVVWATNTIVTSSGVSVGAQWNVPGKVFMRTIPANVTSVAFAIRDTSGKNKATAYGRNMTVKGIKR